MDAVKRLNSPEKREYWKLHKRKGRAKAKSETKEKWGWDSGGRDGEAEEAYKNIIFLQLREKKFEKQYFDEAALLEKKRNAKEYVR